MNSIGYVSALLASLKEQGAGREEIIRKVGRSCVGWPYVFGAWGEECTPAGRRKRKRDDHPTIVSACRVLSGKSRTCAGCGWYLPVRMFDCRGFVKWLLEQAGIPVAGQGCNSQWNNRANWDARGPIGHMPEDRIFPGSAITDNGDGTVTVRPVSALQAGRKLYPMPAGVRAVAVDPPIPS